MPDVVFSVIIPVKDEAPNLPRLVGEIQEAMNANSDAWELLAVDDGSHDASYDILKSLVPQCPQLRILRLVKNCGQSAAFKAGFERAHGDYIITLDADLQNDPRDIPKLLALRERADLICGYRQHRLDGWIKRWISRFANFARGAICRDGSRDTGCSLKVLRAERARKLWMFRGAHRFIPALIKLGGGSMLEVKVRHRARSAGKSKYHLFNRSLAPVVDLLGVAWLMRRRVEYTLIEEKKDADNS